MAMLSRRTEFPPRGGLVRLAHWAKRAYTSPSAYRKLTASRLPVSSCWTSATSPKRVTASTASRSSAAVTASWAPRRAPSRPFHNQDSLGLITAGSPISSSAAATSPLSRTTTSRGTGTSRRRATSSVRSLLIAVANACSGASARRSRGSSRARCRRSSAMVASFEAMSTRASHAPNGCASVSHCDASWRRQPGLSSSQDEQSPLPPETSRPVLVNRKQNPTGQAHECSRDEAGDPPRQYPGVLLVLVPHVPERVRLPRIHVVDDLVADVSQHLERYLLGEVVK